MKSTGITRRIDELGRVVLPVELRRTLDISEKDPIEIYVDGNTVVLKKYELTCAFCRNTDNLIHFKDKNICPSCLTALKSK